MKNQGLGGERGFFSTGRSITPAWRIQLKESSPYQAGAMAIDDQKRGD
jgi:hypothetical protein